MSNETGAKGFSIPMPTATNGFTAAQLEAIRKARDLNERNGTKFVGDYPDCLLCGRPISPRRYERHVQECGGR